jgi:hypothetical protein
MFSTTNMQGEGLAVRHSAGGQAGALVVGTDYWYQAVGEQLFVLEKYGGTRVSLVSLENPACGICTDLLIDGNKLYTLLDGNAVIELDISNPKSPMFVARITSDTLGIRPRHFAMMSGSPVVFGDGGAVRLSDGSSVVSCEGEVTGISNTMSNGIVYAKNRRLYSSNANTFLGSATEIFALSEEANAPIGTLVFVRSIEGKTEVGLMSSELKEIGALCKVTIDGNYQDILVHGSRVYVVTDKGVNVLGVSPKEMRLLQNFPIEAVRSIGIVASNYFALCGDFGYGLFRIDADRGGAGQTLFRVVPANGSMQAGIFDARGVQVSTTSGSMYYAFGKGLTVSGALSGEAPQQKSAVVLGAEAVIEKDGSVTMHTSDAEMQLNLPSPANSVIAVSGDFWFGTQDGIHVVGQRADGPQLLGIQLAGPIVQLIPLLDGSVGFVSGAGVVGVVAYN